MTQEKINIFCFKFHHFVYESRSLTTPLQQHGQETRDLKTTQGEPIFIIFVPPILFHINTLVSIFWIGIGTNYRLHFWISTRCVRRIIIPNQDTSSLPQSSWKTGRPIYNELMVPTISNCCCKLLVYSHMAVNLEILLIYVVIPLHCHCHSHCCCHCCCIVVAIAIITVIAIVVFIIIILFYSNKRNAKSNGNSAHMKSCTHQFPTCPVSVNPLKHTYLEYKMDMSHKG
jgi:hypothetical protein